jgi:pentatricopeptide repeat protein
MVDTSRKIITASNLQGFFFEGLNELNKKSLCPVPESIIFYSSEVLDKFALSQDFFEVSEGKVREKILGMKLLEAMQMSREEQRRTYKEVADMSLLVCGYFSESVNKKIVDTNYYAQLGKMAYGHLNNVSPAFLDIPCFYSMVSTCFETMTTLMSNFASQNRFGKDSELIFRKMMKNGPVSDKELLVSGIIPSGTNKAS